jgi:protein-tyrosine-phosphatase
MAEAFVNARARERGLDVRAESAGTVEHDALNPMAVAAMEEVGVPMTGQRPKLITREMVARADHVVTMGCGVDTESCPAGAIKVDEDWGLDDPAGQGLDSVRPIRDEISRRVDKLLDRLS